MRAALIYGAKDIRVENVPDPRLQAPTDAIVRVLCSGICGSDLLHYGAMPASDQGYRIGHEFIGTVEETGSEVTGLRPGDLVVAPFMYADNICSFCAVGLHTSCPRGGMWGLGGIDGGQGEAVRVPWAQGTRMTLPVAALRGPARARISPVRRRTVDLAWYQG